MDTFLLLLLEILKKNDRHQQQQQQQVICKGHLFKKKDKNLSIWLGQSFFCFVFAVFKKIKVTTTIKVRERERERDQYRLSYRVQIDYHHHHHHHQWRSTTIDRSIDLSFYEQSLYGYFYIVVWVVIGGVHHIRPTFSFSVFHIFLRTSKTTTTKKKTQGKRKIWENLTNEQTSEECNKCNENLIY